MSYGRLYSVHEIKKAAEVVTGGEMKLLPGTFVLSPVAVVVRSDSEVGYYVVRKLYGAWQCTCPQYERHGKCKHLVRATFAVERGGMSATVEVMKYVLADRIGTP